MSLYGSVVEKKRMCRHPNKEARKINAAERQAVYDSVSNELKVEAAGEKQLNKFVARGGEISELATARLAAEFAE